MYSWIEKLTVQNPLKSREEEEKRREKKWREGEEKKERGKEKKTEWKFRALPFHFIVCVKLHLARVVGCAQVMLFYL